MIESQAFHAGGAQRPGDGDHGLVDFLRLRPLLSQFIHATQSDIERLPVGAGNCRRPAILLRCLPGSLKMGDGNMDGKKRHGVAAGHEAVLDGFRR